MPGSTHSFFEELKRRNVFKVGVAYAVVSWILIQIITSISEPLNLPQWTDTLIIVLLALGFPIAIIFAWAFEITPDGIKKESDISTEDSISSHTGRKLDFAIIALLIIGMGYFFWESRYQDNSQSTESNNVITESPMNKTVAVLPFSNFSEDKAQGWFADGLTEEILNALARTRDLLVSSRTSSFSYKNSEKPISTIAKELGVKHVLEGSVRRGGDTIRVTAQLIRASDGFHLWSQTYDRNYKDIIKIQEDVAISIANALKTAMDPEALAKMTHVGTSSVEAYEAFLKAKAIRNSALLLTESFDKIIQILEKAIELDPQFSRAYGMLGQYWLSTLLLSTMGDNTKNLSTTERSRRGIQYLNQAIATKGDPADLNFYRGLIAENNLEFRNAESFYESVIKDSPTHREALFNLIELKLNMGDREGAYTLLRNSENLFAHDTLFYVRQIINNALSVNIKQAVSMADEARAKFPLHPDIAYQSQRAYLMNGDIDKAQKALKVVLVNLKDESSKKLAALRQACATGDNEKAEILYQETLNLKDIKPVDLWLPLQTMGKLKQAKTYLQPLDNDERMVELSSYLLYYHFDINNYPNLKNILELQGIHRPPAQPINFACYRK